MTDAIISEVFGPTVQGEGPSAGRRCSFVRFGRCNLNCSWCDTSYTWDWSGQNGVVFDPKVELRARSVAEILSEIGEHDTDMLVITGGEPMIQQKRIAEFDDLGWFDRIEVETNGTRPISKALLQSDVHFNVSPKLRSSGVDDRARALHPDYVLPALGSIFKFVVTIDNTEADLDEIDALVLKYGIEAGAVWLMPEARNQWQLTSRLPTVAAAAIVRGFNVSGRLHVAAWGDTRGV